MTACCSCRFMNIDSVVNDVFLVYQTSFGRDKCHHQMPPESCFRIYIEWQEIFFRNLSGGNQNEDSVALHPLKQVPAWNILIHRTVNKLLFKLMLHGAILAQVSKCRAVLLFTDHAGFTFDINKPSVVPDKVVPGPPACIP